MNGMDLMYAMDHLDPTLIQDADKIPTKKEKTISPYLAVAACLAILLAIAGLIRYFRPAPESPGIHVDGSGTQSDEGSTEKAPSDTPTTAPSKICYLTIDINPSFQLGIENGTVIQWEGLNDEAQAIYERLDLVGLNAQDALGQLLEELIKEGYLESEKTVSMLLLSARGSEEQWLALQNAVETTRDALLKNQVESFVITQQIEDGEAVQALAEKHHVSAGKIQYMLQLLEDEVSVQMEEVAEYTMAELFGMDKEKVLEEAPGQVGSYDEYGEKLIYVGTTHRYTSYISWQCLSPEYQKELQEIYSPEDLEMLFRPRVWGVVPDVRGLTEAEAVELMHSCGFVARVGYRESEQARGNGYTDGMCYYQDVYPGITWNSDAAISLSFLPLKE